MVALRTDVDDMEKRKFLTLPGFEPRPFDLPNNKANLKTFSTN
jgi:hypothetical protein